MKKLYTLAAIVLAALNLSAQCGNTSEYNYWNWWNDGAIGSDYENYTSCSWQFTSAIQGGKVRIGFYNFITELNYDYVRVYDGLDDSAPLLAELHGDIDPGQIVSTGQNMYITFTTDGSVTYEGFDAWWNSDTGMLTSCSGYLDDGLQNYPNDLWEDWRIVPEGDESEISFTFNYMDMESCCDYIRVYDGWDDQGTLLGSYNGTTIPSETLYAYSGSMYFLFTSDGSVTATGWAGSWNCTYCSGSETHTSCTGTISDGSGSDTYANNSDCQWLVQPTGAFGIEFDFTMLELENGWDYVTIYDGASTSDPVLLSTSGGDLPQDIMTSGGSALITFTSDGSVVNNGWSLDYTCSSVGIDELAGNEAVDVYPNPTSEILNINIQARHAGQAVIRMFDASGKLLLDVQSSDIVNALDVRDLAPGSYILAINSETISSRQLVIIE